MNLFDICVLCILIFGLICGGFRGLVQEVSGIISLVAGFYGANTYFLKLAPTLAPWIANPGVRQLLSFIGLFMAILILVGLMARLIQKLLRLAFLGWVDRTFGLVFGAAKGVLIVTILFILITIFVPGSASFMTSSRTAPYLAKSADAMALLVSKGMRADFYRHLEGFKKEWKL